MRETTHTPDGSPYNPPNSEAVLRIVADAGETGIIGPDIARCFTIPEPAVSPSTRPKDANLQRRLTHVNQILERFQARGWVVMGAWEKSPYYHHVRTRRWFITEAGAGYLAAGMAAGIRASRYDEALRRALELADWHKRLDDVITQAYIDFDPASTPPCEREAAIRVLRGAGCTLGSIGGVFDISRERVRQILMGHRTGPCRCPKHGALDYAGPMI